MTLKHPNDRCKETMEELLEGRRSKQLESVSSVTLVVWRYGVLLTCSVDSSLESGDATTKQTWTVPSDDAPSGEFISIIY